MSLPPHRHGRGLITQPERRGPGQGQRPHSHKHIHARTAALRSVDKLTDAAAARSSVALRVLSTTRDDRCKWMNQFHISRGAAGARVLLLFLFFKSPELIREKCTRLGAEMWKKPHQQLDLHQEGGLPNEA